jgi:hypothetical protein
MKFKLELDIFDELIDDLKKHAEKENITWQKFLTKNITPEALCHLSDDLDNHIIEEILPALRDDEGEYDEESSC